MGKKAKKKARTPQKEKRVSRNSPKIESESTSQSFETVDSEVSVPKERKSCPHLGKGINLEVLTAKIQSSETARCEDCREGADDQRGGKGKSNKAGKKKGSGLGDSRAIWVCLACGHFSCGGVGLPTIPHCHALGHARQTCHPIMVHFEKPQLRWCFPCKTLIQSERIEENGEPSDSFSEVSRLIKGDSEEGSPENADEAHSGAEKSQSVVISGYVARGLSNLGNTCFFNSVLQNLLAMDDLRDYFLKLDVTIGPLTTTLKKLYIETQPDSAGSKNVINPRAFFGCVCLKAPQFKGYQQHDSHELLCCLLDGWSSEELGMRKRTSSSKENDSTSSSPGPTFVDSVFGGRVSSSVCCVECGNTSTVYEPFLDLSLPVPSKKPISKKTQQSARLKKPKLPPKRAVKNRPKLNRPISDASTSKDLPCQSLLSSSGTTPQAEENSAAVEGSEYKAVVTDVAATFSFPEDNFLWMDYLDPEAPSDDYGFSADSFVESILQESKPEHDTLVNDVPPNSVTESEDKINTLVNEVVPLNSVDESEDLKILVNEVSVPTGTEAVAQVSPLNVDTNTQPQFSSVNPWEDEVPLQVQSSEVLLLTYKEEGFGEGEASSAVQGGQEDFVGFGDLFDEPEVCSGHVAGPSLISNASESGFVLNNSSESDPDEVDNSGSEVSVESCLAHFTKPELLSNENAWHCENCSKTLSTQKSEASNRLKPESKILANGFGTETHSTRSVAENGDVDKPASFVSLGEGNAEKKVEAQVQDQPNPSGSYYNCREESLSTNEAADSGCANQESESKKVLNSNHEPEECEDNEVSFETVKVKRSATKRVLINKLPHILTIHLKRFSQDARGRLSKLTGHVDIREIIDLKPYMDSRCKDGEKCEYRLIGIVVHQGTMRSGHYVAYVKGKSGKGNESGSVWFHCSDAYLRETNLEEVLRSEAYILFYQKV